MELTPAADLEHIGAVRELDAEADVRAKLACKTFSKITRRHIFSFLTGERGIVDDEVHRERRLFDCDEGKGRGVCSIGDCFSDVDVLHT